jgi:hypothetical protein
MNSAATCGTIALPYPRILSKRKATVDTLSKINDKIDGVSKRQDIEHCTHLLEQLSKATEALAKNPGAPVATALRESTLVQARNITDCTP